MKCFFHGIYIANYLEGMPLSSLKQRNTYFVDIASNLTDLWSKSLNMTKNARTIALPNLIRVNEFV